MRIKAKTEYAYWAALDVTLHASPSRPAKLSEIADRQGIPEKFLLQVMTSLKQAGIVNSVRGQHGGYVLARSPGSVTLADIFRASGVEAVMSPYTAATRGKVKRSGGSLAKLMANVDRETQGVLAGITLDDARALTLARNGPSYVI